MDHLRDPLHGSIPDSESINKSLKRTEFILVAELDLEHVERDGIGLFVGRIGKDKFCFGIDKFADQPGRADTIDLDRKSVV